MRVRAFAKINLSLRVLGMRHDGYHELRTVFQSIALHDTLTIRRVPGAFCLTCDDPACPSDRTNLIWRAAERLWRAAGKRRDPRGMSIHLTKRIPIQGGLGGGSSDAAAALRALGRLWRVGELRQRTIAMALGADIPFFFEGGTVLGLERGDLLFPLMDYPAAWVAIVIPPFGVATVDAFRWFDEHDEKGVARKASRPFVRNDLQPAVVQHRPEIARIIASLRRSGAALAAMSGSGSAVFGLFGSERAATRAAAAAKCLAGSVFTTRTIDRQTYQRLAAK